MCFTAFQTGGNPFVVVVAMPPLFRHRACTYLRGAALIGVLVLAAFAPPAIAMPALSLAGASFVRAWCAWCSMLLGAAPYLSAGALAAAAAVRWGRSQTQRPNTAWLIGFALLFPGCDCSMNAYATSLRSARPSLAALAVVWGGCCNPLALIATATILGPRLLVCRLACGCIAATLTALAWSRSGAIPPAHGCAIADDYWQAFTRFAGGAVMSFSLAAAISAVCLAFTTGSATFTAPPAFAAIAGAMLSPCSSADPLLARTLFVSAQDQLAFVVAAQCLDVRQIALLWRTFGPARATQACCAAIAACAAGCFFATAS
jgi:hypothetical protein